MKFILFCSFVLFSLGNAELLAFQAKLQASDAMDSVLDLLTNLKDANLQQQQQHDQLNETEMEFGKDLIQRLSEVTDNIQTSYEEIQEHQKNLKGQLEEVTSYLDWIAQRKIDIEKRLYNYHEMRCYSNEMFVKALKENKEAIHVIDLLLDDLNAYKETNGIAFSQTKDFTGKLSMKHIRPLWHQVRDCSHEQEQLDDEDDLGNKLINTASKLKDSIIENLKNLEENEIQSAYDYADYMMHEEYEQKRLDIQNDRKSKFQRALEMDIEMQETAISSTERSLKDAERELGYAKEDLIRRGEYYTSETDRRSSDNQLIEEITRLFETKVSSFVQLN